MATARGYARSPAQKKPHSVSTVGLWSQSNRQPINIGRTP